MGDRVVRLLDLIQEATNILRDIEPDADIGTPNRNREIASAATGTNGTLSDTRANGLPTLTEQSPASSSTTTVVQRRIGLPTQNEQTPSTSTYARLGASRMMGVAGFTEQSVPTTRHTVRDFQQHQTINSPRETHLTPASNPRTNNFALAEVRQLFQPYARPGRNERQRRGNGRGSSGARNAEKYWMQKFLCLSGPSADHCPSQPMKFLLTEAGLGQELIELATTMESSDIVSLVYAKYPALGSCSIEFVVPTGSGRQALLIRVSNSQAVPNGSYLYAAQRRDRIIYIRPDIEIIETPSTHAGNSEIIANQPITRTDTEAIGTSELESLSSSSTSAQSPLVVELDDSLDEDSLTIGDLRRRIYSENPGTQPIHVLRNNFEMQVLGVYKPPSFRLLAEPDVTFIGEFGAGAGALTREYFWTAFAALSRGKYMETIPIFEGEEDHKIPNSDAVLLRNNVFSFVGRFLVHACVHTGISFVGLSKAVVNYILATSPSVDSGFEISISDVPDNDVKVVLEKIQSWTDVNMLTEEDLAQINTVSSQAEVSFQVDFGNRMFVFEQILYYFVIQKRKCQLDAIRNEFVKSPLFKYLRERTFLVDAVFPRSNDAIIPMELVLNKIQLTNPGPENNVVFDTFMSVLAERMSSDPTLTIEVLKCWTGWPFLPETALKVRVGDEYHVHACSYEMEIPSNATYSTLGSFVTAFVTIGTTGFSTI